MINDTRPGWEKVTGTESTTARISPLQRLQKLKFVLISVALIGVVGFLLITGTLSSQQYFITVDQLHTRTDLVGQTIRVTGAVIGTSIKDDQSAETITFTMANVSSDQTLLNQAGGLQKALHAAVTNPTAQKLNVIVVNQPMPDLLQNEAQAILTGKLDAQGVFHADEVLLKCPSRYQSDVPAQTNKSALIPAAAAVAASN